MDVLKDKQFKRYTRLSRYSSFPIYYNTDDDKYVQGTTSQLNQDISYTLYRVSDRDTYDNISLYFYNNPTYYWIICDFNEIQDPFSKPKVGTTLKIPSISNIKFNKY